MEGKWCEEVIINCKSRVDRKESRVVNKFIDCTKWFSGLGPREHGCSSILEREVFIDKKKEREVWN